MNKIFAAVLLASLALAACQKPAPRADQGATVLKIASQRGGTRALLEASHALDGAPYKVEWSEFPSAQTLLEALSDGAVDAGAVGDAPFLFAYSTGARIKAVQASRGTGAGAGSSVAILAPGQSAIHSAADLKGKKIATGKGSIGHYLLLRALEQAGLTVKDVTVVYLSPGDSKAALSAGSVDAWATWNPYVGLATLHDHNRIVIDGQGLLTGVGFEAANQAAIDHKHAALQDFLARIARAQRWGLDHKADYAQALAKDTGLPLDVALYTVDHARTAAVPIDASVIAEEHNTLNHFRAAGVIDKTPDVDQAFDTSFGAAVGP